MMHTNGASLWVARLTNHDCATIEPHSTKVNNHCDATIEPQYKGK